MVSSVTPMMPLAIVVHLVESSVSVRVSTLRISASSALSVDAGVGDGAFLLVLDAEVDEQGGVAAVVEDHVRALAARAR